MVVLNVKHMNTSIFLLETTLTATVDETVSNCVKLHNGILKVTTRTSKFTSQTWNLFFFGWPQVKRVVEHLKDLAEHGVFLPSNMIGLLPDQIEELKRTEPDVELTEPTQAHIFARQKTSKADP